MRTGATSKWPQRWEVCLLDCSPQGYGKVRHEANCTRFSRDQDAVPVVQPTVSKHSTELRAVTSTSLIEQQAREDEPCRSVRDQGRQYNGSCPSTHCETCTSESYRHLLTNLDKNHSCNAKQKQALTWRARSELIETEPKTYFVHLQLVSEAIKYILLQLNVTQLTT